MLLYVIIIIIILIANNFQVIKLLKTSFVFYFRFNLINIKHAIRFSDWNFQVTLEVEKNQQCLFYQLSQRK